MPLQRLLKLPAKELAPRPEYTITPSSSPATSESFVDRCSAWHRCRALEINTALPSRQHSLYSQRVLTLTSRLAVVNRLGRAMADPTRSRILMALLEGTSYPGVLSNGLGLTRSNVSNHLTCLRDCGIVVAEPEGRQTRYEISDPHLAAALTSLVDVTLAVDKSAPCLDSGCPVPGCCDAGAAK